MLLHAQIHADAPYLPVQDRACKPGLIDQHTLIRCFNQKHYNIFFDLNNRTDVHNSLLQYFTQVYHLLSHITHVYKPLTISAI